MTVEEIVENPEFLSMVEDYRSMCLWNLDENFVPHDRRQMLLLADRFERYGDMKSYRYAGRLRQWL